MTANAVQPLGWDLKAEKRPDWGELKGRIDLPKVATSVLGPCHKREGGRFLWRCPFHEERTPSFTVDIGKHTWKYWGCGEYGDAPKLAMKANGLRFPEAVQYVLSVCGLSGGGSTPPNRVFPRLAVPAVVKAPEASQEASMGLGRPTHGPSWKPPLVGSGRPKGRGARVSKREGLGRRDNPQRSAGMGGGGNQADESSGEALRGLGSRRPVVRRRSTSDGQDSPDGRLETVSGHDPDRPFVYPSLAGIRAGRPLIVVEGEFDALLLSQELVGHAAVVTIGSASTAITTEVLRAFVPASPWFIASDGDEAGDRFASRWPATAKRVRPLGERRTGRPWPLVPGDGRTD